LVIYEALKTIYSLSIVLFLFNLLPIAPLDGSKLVGLVIPRSKEHWYQQYLSQGPMFIILLIIFDRVLDGITGFSFLGAYLLYGFDLITVVIMLGT
jgi:Zn-dependent protease